MEKKETRGRPPTTGEYMGLREEKERLLELKRQEIRMRDEIIVAHAERSLRDLSEIPEGPDFIENRSTRKLPTVGEVREEMRGLTTIEVRQLAKDFLVGIDAIIAASKHLKSNYVNRLRVAVRNISAALAEVTHRAGFDSAENRIS